LGKTDYVIQ